MSLNKEEINKTLKFSLWDGIFASLMLGFTQDYFTPFLLLVGATAKHIGMLTGLPSFVASFVQIKSVDFTKQFNSRKKVMAMFVFFQGIMLLPLAAIAFFRKDFIYPFIFIVTIFTCFGALSLPAWSSLMSDLIDKNKRGLYFGWRNKILGFVMIVATFAAGIILTVTKKINPFIGFAIVFFLAFIFRMASGYFLIRMKDMPLEHKKEDEFSFFNFLSRAKESNFAKFVIFISLMNFAVNFCAPFFSVFMLKDLSFSYLLYITIVGITPVTTYIMITRWGRHADKFGNLKVIQFCSFLIIFVPLLWIINHSPLFLVFAQIFTGFAWAGFNIASSNFIYDAVSPQKRTRCIAYFNALNGTAICLGALIGGFMVEKLPNLFGHKILTLFLISAILRIIIIMFFSMRLKEVRSVEIIKSRELFFSVIGIKPLVDIGKDEI